MSISIETKPDLITDDTIINFESTRTENSNAKNEYNNNSSVYSIHPNIRTISYSSLLTLHNCPRKFELNRLLPSIKDVENDEDAAGHLDFGTIVGNGIQSLLVSGDLNKAIFNAFLSWRDNLDSERGLKSRKTLWHALRAIQKFVHIQNGQLANYELAWFDGKPAVELGFLIDLGKGFTYRGKLDALLIHKTKREFLPLECKTTGMNYVNEASYQNSGQGVGYGVVIDRVAHEMQIEYNSYDIFYPVYMTSKEEWIPFRFHKDNTARAKWVQSLVLDLSNIESYTQIDYFPTYGEACFSYGRPCKYFGTCGMSNNFLLGDMASIPLKLDKPDEYPLKFTLIEIIEALLKKDQPE